MRRMSKDSLNTTLLVVHILGIFWLEFNCALKILFVIQWEPSFNYIPIISAAIILGIHYFVLLIMHKYSVIQKSTITALTMFDIITSGFVIRFLSVPNIFVNLPFSNVYFFVISIQLAIMIPRIVYTSLQARRV